LELPIAAKSSNQNIFKIKSLKKEAFVCDGLFLVIITKILKFNSKLYLSRDITGGKESKGI